jgi:hypothetical protein
MDFGIRIFLLAKQPSPNEGRDTDRRRRLQEKEGKKREAAIVAAGRYMGLEGWPLALDPLASLAGGAGYGGFDRDGGRGSV